MVNGLQFPIVLVHKIAKSTNEAYVVALAECRRVKILESFG